jgi:hypothetical protein
MSRWLEIRMLVATAVKAKNAYCYHSKIMHDIASTNHNVSSVRTNLLAVNGKKRLLRKIQEDSLKQLSFSTQAVLVRSPTAPYYVYHMTLTSEYYKQKWIVCHRYSDFHRLR